MTWIRLEVRSISLGADIFRIWKSICYNSSAFLLRYQLWKKTGQCSELLESGGSHRQGPGRRSEEAARGTAKCEGTAEGWLAQDSHSLCSRRLKNKGRGMAWCELHGSVLHGGFRAQVPGSHFIPPTWTAVAEYCCLPQPVPIPYHSWALWADVPG